MAQTADPTHAETNGTVDDELDDELDDDEPEAPRLPVRPGTREMKVFEVAFSDADPLPFALLFRKTNPDGTPAARPDGTEWVEQHEFLALGDAGAGGMLAMSSLVRYDHRGRQLLDLNALLTFMERVLVEGEYDRMVELIERRDITIHLDQLAEVYNWLLEEYTGRPTRPSSPSAILRPGRGRSSKAKRR